MAELGHAASDGATNPGAAVSAPVSDGTIVPPRIVIAPDTFKGSLGAKYVAEHLALGVHRAVPEADVDVIPVADGGEGTVAAGLASGLDPVETFVQGPFGERVRVVYASDGRTAVLELAAAAGLHLSPVDPQAARTASTYGVGQLIAHALDSGCRRLVLGVGGSATTDGGAGMLQALGVQVRGPAGPIDPGGAALAQAQEVDLSGVHPQLAGTEFTLAGDVQNPLLGADGAAAVYGPQKGADQEAIADVEAGLSRWVQVLTEAGVHQAVELAQAPGAGAAGGAGFGALILGARRRPGVQVVLDLVEFSRRVRGADLVITGEGRLDSQTLSGKTPIGVATAAAEAAVLTIAVTGRNELSPEEMAQAPFTAVYALSDLEPDAERSIRQAGELLEKLGARIATKHLWQDLAP